MFRRSSLLSRCFVWVADWSFEEVKLSRESKSNLNEISSTEPTNQQPNGYSQPHYTRT